MVFKAHCNVDTCSSQNLVSIQSTSASGNLWHVNNQFFLKITSIYIFWRWLRVKKCSMFFYFTAKTIFITNQWFNQWFTDECDLSKGKIIVSNNTVNIIHNL